MATTQQSNDPNNHSKIDIHIEEKCYRLHPKINRKNKKKDNKKKNAISIDSRNQVEINSELDENIIHTSRQN